MNDEYYYVAIDGDSIGKRLERYIVNDNLDELSPLVNKYWIMSKNSKL
jgi:hypothetical protein